MELAAQPGVLESHEQVRVTGNMPAIAEKRYWPVWRRWIQAARELGGDVGDDIRTQRDLWHIRRYCAGYEVIIKRGRKRVVYRLFPGFSQQSLETAMRFRDEALKTVPPNRSNSIPPHVLQALGLSRPVIGVNRVPQRRVYRVEYYDGEGKRRTRSFYFRRISEAAAYAAAVAFRKELLRHSNVARRPIAVPSAS